MLSKFLVTLTVIVIAFFVVRQRHLNTKTSKKTPAITQKAQKNKAKTELASDMRAGAYIFLILMVTLGATLYYFDWQDDHKILTVNLHRSDQTQPVSYEIYKYQLQERAFITIDGRSIAVASNERMEVLGLNE